MKKMKRLGLIFSIIIGFIASTGIVHSRETVKMMFNPDISLRDLAEKYLSGPDDWEIILFFNGFKHPIELRPGNILIIPADLFHRTMDYLQKASDITHQANMEGARILAKESIEASIQLQDQAKNLKKQGKLELAEKAAKEAIFHAENALNEAKRKKIQAVSAILDYKQGTVQSRKPEQPVWNDARIKQELIEQERIRTLAESRAGILFIDGSLIQMDENSLAVVGKMKDHVIQNIFEAEISIIQGDVLVHLSSMGGRKEFSVTAPGVDTTIRSKKFRTSRNATEVTRIANYDGEIDVESNQRKVTIKKDEGTKIDSGKSPTDPQKLLQPPLMIHPMTSQIIFSRTISFEWETVENAAQYVLEISTDRNFTTIAEKIDSGKNRWSWDAPGRGVYYYRIYTIDPDGFSGPPSEPVDFFADLDTLPPYLAIRSPADNQVVLINRVQIQGTTESQASVMVNNEPVAVKDDGTFEHTAILTSGKQTIIISANDRAGNTTTVTRTITCNLEEHLIVFDTLNPIIVNRNQIVLSGKIKPLIHVKLNDVPLDLPETFSHTVTLSEGRHTLTFTATSPHGDRQDVRFDVHIDLTPPEIQMSDFPSHTREKELLLTGSVSESAVLTVNDLDIPIRQDRYSATFPLTEGENLFRWIATDLAGNKSQKTNRIIRDTQQPVIIGHSLSTSKTNGAEIITCQVKARDDGTGLARTGRFYISVLPGNFEFQGILTLNPGNDQFEGSIFVPPGIQGQVRIKELHIPDRLGNVAKAP